MTSLVEKTNPNLPEAWKENGFRNKHSKKNPQNGFFGSLFFSRTCSRFHTSFWPASLSIYSTHRHPDAWNGYWRTRGVAPSLTESVFYKFSFHRYGNQKNWWNGDMSLKNHRFFAKNHWFFCWRLLFLVDWFFNSFLVGNGIAFHWLTILAKKEQPYSPTPYPNLAKQHVAPATTAATQVGNEELTSTHREKGGAPFHPQHFLW